MADTDTLAKAGTSTAVTKAPGRWRVRLSHPNSHKKIVFSSVSEMRARRHIERRYPRGSEAYLESPDGVTEHYEGERADEYGIEAEPWAPFDLEAYKPPEEQEPPGQSEWADQEG
jgi:hypothetical protein